MSEDSSKKEETPQHKPPNIPGQKPEKPTAAQALIKFLQANNMDFMIRRQKGRFIEDSGIIIEPPVVVVFYRDKATEAGTKVEVEEAPNG